jgi:hypothetical protein
MRCTQIIGLSPQAHKFLEENQKKVLIKCSCPDCETYHIPMIIKEKYADASSQGMFDDGPSLFKYQLKDDTWIYEYVQACPWSSGPMIFTALAWEPVKNPYHIPDKIIQETLWSEQEINQT